MPDNEDKKFILQRVLNGGIGPIGPTGPLGATGPGGAPLTSLITHDGDERNSENLANLLDEILYITLTGGNFSHGLGLQEKGFTVINLPLSWTKNKITVVSQIITGTGITSENAGTTATSHTLAGINLLTNGQWFIAIDDGTTIVNLNVILTFTNKVHYGARPVGAYNDAFILGLSGNNLQINRTKQFTVNAGASDKIYWAQPSAYGTPTFTVGGFEGGFTLEATISHINASGFAENYDIWGSDQVNLGLTTVDVT